MALRPGRFSRFQLGFACVSVAALLFTPGRVPVEAAPNAPFSKVVVEAGVTPWGKALGDIDGDGLIDAVAGFDNENVYWYQSPSWTKRLIGPYGGDDLQVADVNNDGAPDVVTNGSRIVWYENPQGRGGNPALDTWSSHTIDSGTGSHDVLIGDVNNDGRTDVAIRVEFGPTYLYLQNSADSWTKVAMPNAENGNALAFSDIDGDQRIDIVENGYWLQQPANPITGTWARRDFASWIDGSSVMVADMNHDGRQDVVLSPSESPGRISWFEKPSDPINGTWFEHVILDPVSYVHRVRIGDFNKDGNPDVAFAEMDQSPSDRVGIVYAGDARGLTWSLQVLATTAGHNIATADIDRDGDLDILNANWENGTDLEIWRNDQNNSISLDNWHYTQVDSTKPDVSFGLTFGDIDQDGLVDIVTGREWYKNPGADLTGTWIRTDLGAPYDAMLVLDVDGTGPGIIAQVASGNSADVYWLKPTTRSANAFASTLVGSTPASRDGATQGYMLADINPGGRPELVFSSDSGTYYFSVPAIPSTGNWPRVQVNANGTQEGISAADINRDGAIDLVGSTHLTPTSLGQQISWWQNPKTASGNWISHIVGNTVLEADRVHAADINNDGRVDIVVTDSDYYGAKGNLSWFEQTSAGTWISHTVAANLPAAVPSMDVGDFNQDGKTDIVIGEHAGPLLQTLLFQNGGGGTSWTQHVIDTNKESHQGTLAIDLDNDGDLDVVSIAYNSPQFVHLWRNDASSAPSAGTLTLTSSSYITSENDIAVSVGVARTGGTTGSVGVAFATSDATALAGSDYASASGTLLWADGDSATKTLSVSILRDAIAEGAEAFSITLGNPTGGASLGTPATASVTIGADGLAGGGAGSVSFSAPSYGIGEPAGTVPLTVLRTVGSDGAISVNYSTFDGLATANSDYTSTSGSLSWADGDTSSKTFTVAIANDNTIEGGETFFATLGAPTGGASLAVPSTTMVTIADDDSAGTVVLTAPTYTVSEGGGVLAISATRVGGSSGAIGVDFSTSNGTALAGSDYTATNGVLSWADGDTSNKTFLINVTDDTLAEASETFSVTISRPTGGAMVGSPNAATTTIVDNDGSVATSGLQLWLKADAGLTTSGNAVSQWADQSGNGRNAAQTATASRPALISGATNGRPAVLFDGVNDFMTFALPVNGVGAMTLVLVSSNSTDKNGGSTNAESSAIFWNETNSWGTVYLSPYQTNVKFRFGTGQTGNVPSFSRPTSLGTAFSTSIAIKSGSTDSLYVNGAPVVTQSGKLPSIAATNGTGNLGRGYNNNTYFPGMIAEALVYNRALSDTERQSLENYLNTKYFVVATPAITVSAPANGNTWTAGTTAAVAWSSSGITGNVDIQLSIDDGGTWTTLVTNTPNDGNQPVVVPNTPSTRSSIRVSQSSGGTASGTSSGRFTITGPNAAPTVAQVASATPAAVTGTATALSVLGNDDEGEAGLTYTWATTGAPPAPVTFSSNGTNAAKSTSATFTAPGSYSFVVTLRDVGNLTATSAVTVTVAQTLTSISVTPPTASVGTSATQTFVATTRDQFGVSMTSPPTISWSVSGGGTISTTGLFSAGTTAGGPFTVTAANGAINAIANVTITPVNAAPTVAQVASATPAAVTGTATALSVLGNDDEGEAGLTYTWATTGAPPAPVTFSSNGTNAAKSTSATFTAPGSYSFVVTLRDVGNLTATSAVTVTVAQTLTSISVTPPTASVGTSATQTFVATTRDQFGVSMTSPPTISWSVSGGGTISTTGLFSAGTTAGGPFTVTAANGAINAIANVTITPVNAAPTVAQVASATPAAVTGTATALSVLGNDDEGEAGLTYTWATTGAPPAPVTFSSNGTNAAKSTSATFTAPGSYSFVVTLRDVGNLTATSAVTVTVAQTLTSISVTPPTASVGTSATQTFVATTRDQFGVSMTSPPTISWSVSGGGTISTTGLFSAGTTAGGPFTVTAANGAINAIANVTITPVNAAPTVAQVASATPAAVTGTATALSVLGNDDEGEAGLTYTWATTGAPPAPVTFSSNGTNAAKSTSATFTAPGSYSFVVTLRDVGNLTATSAVTVTVAQTLTSISVTPPTASVGTSATQTFVATTRDQFGVSMTSPPTISWSVSGGGTISTTGLFSAGTTAGGPFTVTAANGAINAIANVTITQGGGTSVPSYVAGAAVTNNNSATSLTASFAAPNTAGNLIVVAVSWGSSAALTCSDSLGNIYAVATTQYDSSNNQSLAICYAANAKAGSNAVTVTFASSTPYRRLLIHEYSGIATSSAVDVVAKNVANGSTAVDAITSTAATTTASGDLIFGAVMDDTGTTTITAGTGFTQRLSVNNKDAVSQDRVQAVAGSIAATQRFGAAHRYLAQMIAFKHR